MNYQRNTITLGAGESRNFPINHTFFAMMAITGASSCKFHFDGENPEIFEAGLGLEVPEQKNINIFNHNATQIIVDFAVSNGKIYDNRLVVDDEIKVLNVSNTYSVGSGDVKTASSIPEDATRKNIIISIKTILEEQEGLEDALRIFEIGLLAKDTRSKSFSAGAFQILIKII